MRILIITIFTICSLSFYGQSDEFDLTGGVSLSMIPINLKGTMDIGDHSESVSSSDVRVIAPKFRYVDTTIYSAMITMNGGLHIPLINKENWSLGLNLNVGFGATKGINGDGGLNWLALSFPEYIYFRKPVGDLYLSAMLGWQETISGLKFGMPSARFDVEFAEKSSLGLYTGLYRPKYYILLTNGDVVPALRISEFGLVYSVKF